MPKLKKHCKYCGTIDNLYTQPSGIKLCVCLDHYELYKKENSAKIQQKINKNKKCKYCDEHNLKNLVHLNKQILPCCNKHYDLYKNDHENKRKKTNNDIYGTDYGFQSEIVKNKIKKTNIIKYDVENPSQSKEIQEKRKTTCLNKYGAEYSFQNNEVRKKIENTNELKYGNKCSLLNDNVKEKCKQTTFKKYGFENANKSLIIKEKKIKTFLKKYNAENPLKVKYIRNKIEITKKNIHWDILIAQLNEKKIIPIFDKKYYINNNENFKFKCLKCNNEFMSNGTNSQKIICYNCDNSKSLPEFEIEDWLKSLNKNLNIKRNVWFTFKNKTRREIDILVNDKIAIFYHGLYWHSNIYKNNNSHKEIHQLFTKREYTPIQIFENEWINKQDIVKSIILSKLNINQTKIYARKTVIKEINNKLYQLFLEENHIQGHTSSKIKLGMFLDDKLISVIGIGKSRFKKDETEIIRYCSLLNTQIIGGLAKFLSYIKNNYNFENIISYIDLRYFDGSSYLNNGFELESITKPNYYYFKKSGNERYNLLNRIQFQKHKLKTKLNKFDYNLTESENMLINDYLKIFDAGNYKLRLIGN